MGTQKNRWNWNTLLGLLFFLFIIGLGIYEAYSYSGLNFWPGEEKQVVAAAIVPCVQQKPQVPYFSRAPVLNPKLAVAAKGEKPRKAKKDEAVAHAAPSKEAPANVIATKKPETLLGHVEDNTVATKAPTPILQGIGIGPEEEQHVEFIPLQPAASKTVTIFDDDDEYKGRDPRYYRDGRHYRDDRYQQYEWQDRETQQYDPVVWVQHGPTIIGTSGYSENGVGRHQADPVHWVQNGPTVFGTSGNSGPGVRTHR